MLWKNIEFPLLKQVFKFFDLKLSECLEVTFLMVYFFSYSI